MQHYFCNKMSLNVWVRVACMKSVQMKIYHYTHHVRLQKTLWHAVLKQSIAAEAITWWTQVRNIIISVAFSTSFAKCHSNLSFDVTNASHAVTGRYTTNTSMHSNTISLHRQHYLKVCMTINAIELSVCFQVANGWHLLHAGIFHKFVPSFDCIYNNNMLCPSDLW